jgi:anti-sigma regulatory factor (Ser/Thr protein kinase)
MFSAPHNHDVRYLAGQTTVVEDAIKDNAHKESLISAGLGLRSLLRAPILQGTGMTALGVAMIEPRQWTEEEISLVESIAAQTRAAVEAARHIMRERALLRDVLASVTEGKLFLADTAADLPAPQVQFGSPVVLDKESGLAELRDLIRKASRQANHEEVRTFDTMTAASEAGMNAIVHADRGVATVSIGPNDSLQIRIEDKGMGIAFDDLPKATLSRGYSTKSTLGHGLKMMLETIDRFFLLTGATGTTVVLEQEKVEPPPSWLAKQHLK